MKFFLDTHDRTTGTFPPALSKQDVAGFYETYKTVCREEGVTSIRVHLGLEAGRAFCLTMAPDAEAVRRVHERLGLPFDSIVEVTTVAPGDMFP